MASIAFKSVILGAPASGKGTIAARILKNFNMGYISSGDKLRQHIQKETATGLTAKKYIDEGKLVPDEVMIKLIANEIYALDCPAWLLDGFPRTVRQAEEFWKDQKLDLVINLVVPFDEIIERTRGRLVHLPSGRVYNKGFNDPKVAGRDDVTGEPLVQRNDDKPEVVRKRLEQYRELTEPVIDFYKSKEILHSFEGRSSDEIWPHVLGTLIRFVPVHIRTPEQKQREERG